MLDSVHAEYLPHAIVYGSLAEERRSVTRYTAYGIRRIVQEVNMQASSRMPNLEANLEPPTERTTERRTRSTWDHVDLVPIEPAGQDKAHSLSAASDPLTAPSAPSGKKTGGQREMNRGFFELTRCHSSPPSRALQRAE